MKSIIKYVIAIIAVQSLVSCAYLKGKKAIIKNRDMAYLASRESKELQVPADLNATALGDELIIPGIAQNGDKQPPVLIPPHSLAEQLSRKK